MGENLQLAGSPLRNPPVLFWHETRLHLAIDQHPVCRNRARRERWPRKWFLLGRNPWRLECTSIFWPVHVERRRWRSIVVKKTFDRINWPLTSKDVYFFGNACAGRVWKVFQCLRLGGVRGSTATSDLVGVCLCMCVRVCGCVVVVTLGGWADVGLWVAVYFFSFLKLFFIQKTVSFTMVIKRSGQRSVDAIFTCVDLHEIVLVSRLINMLSVTKFVPKGIISGVRVQAGLHLDMLDADRSPNMQLAFLPELHRWISRLTARHVNACPPRDLLITMVKKTAILYKKEFRKMKKKVVL